MDFVNVYPSEPCITRLPITNRLWIYPEARVYPVSPNTLYAHSVLFVISGKELKNSQKRPDIAGNAERHEKATRQSERSKA